MFLERKSQVKVTKNRLFFNDKQQLIRIVSVVKKTNVVNIFNYSIFENQTIDYDTAGYYLTPAFRIGEVAKILDRKPDTIRKYEQRNLIPEAKKFAVNVEKTASIRVYTLRDVYDLIEIFSMRNSAGRPRGHQGIDKIEALKLVNARFQKIKNVGD